MSLVFKRHKTLEAIIKGQSLVTDQFVASLLQPIMCQLIRSSTCTLVHDLFNKSCDFFK
jgi:hypothetical protein